MISHRFQNILVGVTTILGLAALALLLTLFGYLPQFMQETYQVRVDMANVAGLGQGSRVRFRGIDVGQIESVSIDPKSQSGVMVLMLIHKQVALPQGTTAVAEIPLLGRSRGMKLEPPAPNTNQTAQALSKDGTAVINGKTQSITDQLGAQLSGTVDQFVERIDNLSVSFKQLSDEWVEVGKNVNNMLEPRELADVDAKKVKSNVTTLVARMDMRLTELQTAIDGVNQWFNDPELKKSIKGAASNIDTFTSKLNTGADQFTTLVEESQGLVKDSRGQINNLGSKYAKVADDLSDAIRTIQLFTEQARSGKGTLGKLMTDPSLYDSVDDSVQRIGKLMTELKVMVEKWQTEGLPIKVE